jgi:hypothetical protein
MYTTTEKSGIRDTVTEYAGSKEATAAEGSVQPLQIFVLVIGAALPCEREALARDALDHGGTPAAAAADAASELRVAVNATTADIAAQPFTLRKQPHAELARTVDDAVWMVAAQVVLAAALTLADRSISSVLSLLHDAFHQVPPRAAR